MIYPKSKVTVSALTVNTEITILLRDVRDSAERDGGIRMPDGPKEMNPRAWLVTKQGMTGDLYEALAWDNGGKPLGVSVSTPALIAEGAK